MTTTILECDPEVLLANVTKRLDRLDDRGVRIWTVAYLPEGEKRTYEVETRDLDRRALIAHSARLLTTALLEDLVRPTLPPPPSSSVKRPHLPESSMYRLVKPLLGVLLLVLWGCDGTSTAGTGQTVDDASLGATLVDASPEAFAEASADVPDRRGAVQIGHPDSDAGADVGLDVSAEAANDSGIFDASSESTADQGPVDAGNDGFHICEPDSAFYVPSTLGGSVLEHGLCPVEAGYHCPPGSCNEGACYGPSDAQVPFTFCVSVCPNIGYGAGHCNSNGDCVIPAGPSNGLPDGSTWPLTCP